MWCLLLLFPLLSLHAEISALYLSWYGDPTTSMTIQWHTPLEEIGDSLLLDGEHSVTGLHIALDSVLVHKVTLEGLIPDTEYSFQIGTDANIYSFRTAPADLENPLRFVIGGDIYASKKLFRRMSKTVKENNPLFVVLGGDIAYALSTHPFRGSALKKWTSFLKEWTEAMVTPEGRIIPFLLVPGNHDIASDNYDLFFDLFAFPKKQLYRAIDFGSYLSLILLDTGHFQPVEGQQTFWLEKALSSRTETPYRFAIYHEAAYPSFYPYEDSIPKKIRTHWAPLFEKYRLPVAFENHNHAFKRTYPLKAGQVDPEGVIYLGDGSWGASPRKTHDLWYLEKRSRKNSTVLVELTKQTATIQALDLLNNPLDELVLSPIN